MRFLGEKQDFYRCFFYCLPGRDGAVKMSTIDDKAIAGR